MAEIGQALHEARIRARIDISEIEARTKIRAKYLRALENEEWDLLPGDVFVKSFLKTYGDALGLDSRLLVDEFKRRYDRPTEHDLRPSPSTAGRDRERLAREPRRPRGPRGPALSPRGLVVLVIILIVVGLGAYGELGGGSTTTGGTSTPASAGGSHKHTGSSGRSSTTTTTRTTTTTTTTSTTVSLSIVPTAAVWICVERADGKALIPGVTYDVGETVPVVTGHTLLVNLGNADVKLTVDGQPYALTAKSAPVGLKLNASGVSSLTSGPTCGQ